MCVRYSAVLTHVDTWVAVDFCGASLGNIPQEWRDDSGASALLGRTLSRAKVQCQGLGLIKFVGDLLKLQMLTERIM